MSTVTSFDEAYAHHPSNKATLSIDQTSYLINDTITLTCTVENGGDPKDTRWGFSNGVSPKKHPATYSFPADTFGLGEYDVFCFNHPHSLRTPVTSFNHSEKVIFFIVDEIFPIPDLDISPIFLLDIEINDDDPITPLTESTKKSGNGGCADCTPPTIGTDSQGTRFVNNGVVLNGEKFQMGNYKTHIPMMFTEIGVENHLELKVYENHGAYNLDFMQFGIVKEIGSSMNVFEPRLEIDIKNTSNDIHNPALEGIELFDKQGIMSEYRVELSLLDCMEGFTHECLKLDIFWTFDKVPENVVLAIGGWDNTGSSFVQYLNDGLTVTDPNYVEPTPEEPYKPECVTPDVLPMNGGTRNDCWWRAMHMGWLWQ